MAKKTLWLIFALLAICIGLYPGLYFILDRKFGLLNTKDNALLNNLRWNIAFYVHIILGGLALLIGWTQFSKKLRAKKINLHRNIGKTYVISALASALASLYISFYATGGLVSSLGFFCLGIIWFYCTLSAFLQIRKGRIDAHEKMMIYSYACCFAAATLRIWLPLLIIVFSDFTSAYRLVAWLCWVPNLFIAFFIIKKMEKSAIKTLL